MRNRVLAVGAAASLLLALGGTAAYAAPSADVATTPPTVAPCKAVVPGTSIVVPDDFLPAPLKDTRSAGHYELAAGGGLHVYTDDATSQAKVAEYVAVAKTSLALAGEPSLTWTGTAARPGFQLVVDLEDDGTFDGILVGEPVYGDRWWANNQLIAHVGTPVPPALVSPGGDGSAVAGTLSDWLAAYPKAVVGAVGFSLGSGVKGDGVIGSLTFACVSRDFKAKPVVTTSPSTTTPAPSTSATTTTPAPSTSASTTAAPSTTASTTAPTTSAAPLASPSTTKAAPTLAATGPGDAGRLALIALALLALGVGLSVIARPRWWRGSRH